MGAPALIVLMGDNRKTLSMVRLLLLKESTMGRLLKF